MNHFGNFTVFAFFKKNKIFSGFYWYGTILNRGVEAQTDVLVHVTEVQ